MIKTVTKYLGVTIVSLFLATNIVSAQVAETPATLSLQQEYQQALVSLIGLLQQQVQVLIDQLKAVQSNQDTINSKVDTIIQNQATSTQIAPEVSTPQTSIPVFGAISPAKSITFHLQPRYNNGNETKDNINYWNIYAYYWENGLPTQTEMVISSDKGSLSNSNAQSCRLGIFGGADKGCGVYESFVGDTTDIITATASGFTATTTLDSYFQ